VRHLCMILVVALMWSLFCKLLHFNCYYHVNLSAGVVWTWCGSCIRRNPRCQPPFSIMKCWRQLEMTLSTTAFHGFVLLAGVQNLLCFNKYFGGICFLLLICWVSTSNYTVSSSSSSSSHIYIRCITTCNGEGMIHYDGAASRITCCYSNLHLPQK